MSAEKYFKNNDISDIDLLVYYHTEGINLGHKINKKRRIIKYTNKI
jgi:hypothetical protein